MAPLLEAAAADHIEAARFLLDAGADLYIPNNGGETPLLMAVQEGSLGVFRLLVERECQMDVSVKGARLGEEFYGCVNYPKCRQTSALPVKD